jgi:Icc-related predicted phosphoesterase
MSKKFTICAISDTHGKHRQLKLPPHDILIHAGDSTFYGEPHELKDFAMWLNEQESSHIVVTFGNHEVWAQNNLEEARTIMTKYCPAINLLINETVIIEGIKIFASPASPFYCDWAWNYARSDEEAALRNIPHIRDIWTKIPTDTDILVTHGPPYRILDQLPMGDFVGDYNLMSAIIDIKPDLHFFGHIHTNGGMEEHYEGISFYNCSICDERYLPINPITVVEYILE